MMGKQPRLLASRYRPTARCGLLEAFPTLRYRQHPQQMFPVRAPLPLSYLHLPLSALLPTDLSLTERGHKVVLRVYPRLPCLHCRPRPGTVDWLRPTSASLPYHPVLSAAIEMPPRRLYLPSDYHTGMTEDHPRILACPRSLLCQPLLVFTRHRSL